MKNRDKLIAGIASGILIFIYGIFLLAGGLLKAQGNDIIIRLFGKWYEGMFLLFTGIAFVGAFIYRKNIFLLTAMFFAGIYTFLTISSKFGGGIFYANNFGFIFIFMGIGGIIAYIFQKPRNPYNLLFGQSAFFAGITFIVSLTLRLYWIIAVGLVMIFGISVAIWAIARNKYAKNTHADNEKESYAKDPDRKYIDTYKNKDKRKEA